MELEQLGFNEVFERHVDSAKLAEYQLARVTEVNKNSYVVHNGEREAFGEITGKFLFNVDSSMDYPAVGDWVYVQCPNDESMCLIHEVVPRKSLLRRKTPGKKIEFQLIGANIDTALIIQSIDTDYNIRRLERYLVMVYESHIDPVVLLSKSDLVSPDEIEQKLSDIHQVMPGIEVIPFSNKDNSSVDGIRNLLIAGKTYCLLGSSGVGKTTLLNTLLKTSAFQTRTVREKDGKGRHATTRRQLVFVDSGAMIIDTPGMRELGNVAVESGLSDTFDEITLLIRECRYKNCSHTIEKGCAVLAALNDGRLSRARYENYIKMSKESAHYEMSYVEKRRKDKQFGKMCKSVMKNKKNKR